jgi:hypothetical protein
MKIWFSLHLPLFLLSLSLPALGLFLIPVIIMADGLLFIRALNAA